MKGHIIICSTSAAGLRSGFFVLLAAMIIMAFPVIRGAYALVTISPPISSSTTARTCGRVGRSMLSSRLSKISGRPGSLSSSPPLLSSRKRLSSSLSRPQLLSPFCCSMLWAVQNGSALHLYPHRSMVRHTTARKGSTTALFATASVKDDNENDDIDDDSIEEEDAPVVTKQMEPIKPTKKIRKTQLKADLKNYRSKQATAIDKPPHFIFTNAALDDIYAILPTTKEELLQAKGIGPKKLEQFGDDILSIVSKYTASASSKSAALPDQPIPRPVEIDPSSLTLEQRRAVDLCLREDRPDVFITGSAGTGKSYVLKFLVQELERQSEKIKIGICAPTGVAAVNVGGSTLHSYFGIGLGTGSLSNLMKKVDKNKEAKKRIDETDVLIIDECSMLSSHLLEVLDAVAREVRQGGRYSDVPFGGMQVIAFGDFFQLPPIVSRYDRDSNGDRQWRPFCFDSPVWSELGLSENTIELVEIQRQENEEFANLLNKVRVGRIRQNDIWELNSRCTISETHPLPTDGIVPTRLYILNKDVDAENESRLAALEGNEVVSVARNQWREAMPIGTTAAVRKQMTDSLQKEMPEEVRLKVGAQVMLTRNKDLDKNLVNGSRGVIVRIDKGGSADSPTYIPLIRFDSGVITSVAPVEAVRYNPESGKPGCLVRLQLPLKLAWAMTVHKSQGSTLSRALLDIGAAFEYGQCYVAMSRVKNLEGLWLQRPARLHNIKVSPQVLHYFATHAVAVDTSTPKSR